MRLFGRSGQTGSTLIETLVSVTIAAIAMVSLAMTMGSGIYFSDDNHLRQYALNALRAEIETLRTASYDTVAGLDGSGFQDSRANEELARLREANGSISVADSFGGDIKTVTLTVTWLSKGDHQFTESLSTFITRKGINRA